MSENEITNTDRFNACIDAATLALAKIKEFYVDDWETSYEERQIITERLEDGRSALCDALTYGDAIGINAITRGLLEAAAATFESAGCILHNSESFKWLVIKPLDAALSAMAATLPAA